MTPLPSEVRRDTSPDQIAEARRLLEKITPGDWKVWASQPDVVVLREDGKPIANVDTWTGRGVIDAEFIAAAPRLVRALLDHVATLTRQREETEQELAEIWKRNARQALTIHQKREAWFAEKQRADELEARLARLHGAQGEQRK